MNIARVLSSCIVLHFNWCIFSVIVLENLLFIPLVVVYVCLAWLFERKNYSDIFNPLENTLTKSVLLSVSDPKELSNENSFDDIKSESIEEKSNSEMLPEKPSDVIYTELANLDADVKNPDNTINSTDNDFAGKGDSSSVPEDFKPEVLVHNAKEEIFAKDQVLEISTHCIKRQLSGNGDSLSLPNDLGPEDLGHNIKQKIFTDNESLDIRIDDTTNNYDCHDGFETKAVKSDLRDNESEIFNNTADSREFVNDVDCDPFEDVYDPFEEISNYINAELSGLAVDSVNSTSNELPDLSYEYKSDDSNSGTFSLSDSDYLSVNNEIHGMFNVKTPSSTSEEITCSAINDEVPTSGGFSTPSIESASKCINADLMAHFSNDEAPEGYSYLDFSNNETQKYVNTVTSSCFVKGETSMNEECCKILNPLKQKTATPADREIIDRTHKRDECISDEESLHSVLTSHDASDELFESLRFFRENAHTDFNASITVRKDKDEAYNEVIIRDPHNLKTSECTRSGSAENDSTLAQRDEDTKVDAIAGSYNVGISDNISPEKCSDDCIEHFCHDYAPKDDTSEIVQGCLSLERFLGFKISEVEDEKPGVLEKKKQAEQHFESFCGSKISEDLDTMPGALEEQDQVEQQSSDSFGTSSAEDESHKTEPSCAQRVDYSKDGESIPGILSVSYSSRLPDESVEQGKDSDEVKLLGLGISDTPCLEETPLIDCARLGTEVGNGRCSGDKKLHQKADSEKQAVAKVPKKESRLKRFRERLSSITAVCSPKKGSTKDDEERLTNMIEMPTRSSMPRKEKKP